MSDHASETPADAAAPFPVELDDARVEVRALSVGPMDNNAYILRDVGSDQVLLIDAANEADRLLAALDGFDVVAILTTHGHQDHWQALGQVADATGAPAWLHPADAGMVPRPADHAAVDGARIAFGSASIRILHTPGHTPGSVCALLGGGVLFTGDTLFPGGPGRTGTDGDFRQIMRSLTDRLFVLDDAASVHPGHGRSTTLGAERPHLPAWRARGW